MKHVYLPTIAEVKNGQDWSELEDLLLQCCATGDGAVLPGKMDLPDADDTDPARTVRATLIRYLILGGCNSDKRHSRRPHPKGVQLQGARIVGALNMEACISQRDLLLWKCRFPDPINMQDAELGSANLAGSHADHLVNLHRLKTETSVMLHGGFHAARGVDLGGARVGGQLNCRDGTFHNPGGRAILADSARIGASVVLSGKKFSADGEVNLAGTRIGGQLDCADGTFSNPDKRAINANGAQIGADVFLCGEKFRAEGEVNLIRASIGGQLDCEDGTFQNPGRRAINADTALIGADVFMRGEHFVADGEVNLRGAQIGGQFACTDGTFKNPAGCAINADAAQIGADVFMRGEHFVADGEVNLRGAQIGGQFACTDGTFQNPAGCAINAEAAQIGADVFMRRSNVTGDVDFVRADVTGNLRIEAVRLDGTVDLEAARVGGGLFWKRVKGTVPVVDLTEAYVGALRDDRESWDSVQFIHFGGFRYDSLESPQSFLARKTWLGKAAPDTIPRTNLGKGRVAGDPNDFDPRPYTQLATVLRRDGHRKMAARILELREDKTARVERDRALARMQPSAWGEILPAQLAWLGYYVSVGFKGLFGYGHAPGRVFLTLIPLLVFTTLLYAQVYATGQMAPNSDVILTSADWLAGAQACLGPVADCAMAPLRAWEDTASYSDYETFKAYLYALDLFVPLDALGQESAWAPSRDRGWWGWVGYYARMPIQMAGWIITAMGAAVVTGLVGRKD